MLMGCQKAKVDIHRIYTIVQTVFTTEILMSILEWISFINGMLSVAVLFALLPTMRRLRKRRLVTLLLIVPNPLIYLVAIIGDVRGQTYRKYFRLASFICRNGPE